MLRVLVISLLFMSVFLLPVSASRIVEVCPNPYGSDDAEYVIVNATAFCVLDDGEGEVPINSTGIVVVAKNITAYELTFGKKADIQFSKRFALSNEGETIRLLEGGKVVDKFTYKPKEGMIFFRTSKGWDFRYQDWTSFSPVDVLTRIKVIVSPASYCFRGSTIWLASYTFTDLRTVKGNITLFLDASPVGGIPVEELEISKRYKTYFLSSTSYKNFHYKFATDGKKVVITTENWKWSKRGFIVEFESERAARLLKNVLLHDVRCSSQPGKAGGLKADYSMGTGKIREFESRVEVFVLPDCNPVFDFISKARQRLYIEVPYMDFTWFDDSMPLLDAILKAARNGTEVKIILDSEHNKERNERTLEFLKRIAIAEGLNIDGRLSRMPLHGKLVISDDDALITSANFNRYGLRLNREVGIILYGKDASEWLAGQFMSDWEKENPGYLIPAIVILSIAVVVAYKAMAKR